MSGILETAAVVLAVAAGFVPAALRWLRVAQREHYLAGSATRFAARWTRASPVVNGAGLAILAALIGVGIFVGLHPLLLTLGASVLAFWPYGLPVRGRTAPLAWTARLRRLAGALAVAFAVIVAAGVVAGRPGMAVLAGSLAVPLLVDAALLALGPVERRLTEKWVDSARRRLAGVAPLVVAITGSYGKTSTKEFVRHLLGATHAVVASPGSFNNRLGLARTINDHLTPGTQVLVAEMGAYGKGEIADLCSWIRPTIGVITAIGPVHLERFGSLDNVAAAKAEIVADAEVAVLNVDHPALAELAGRLGPGTRVVRCSAQDPAADVHAGPDGAVRTGGEPLGAYDADAHHGGNVACAVAAALAAGVPREVVAARIAGLPGAEHRASVVTGDAGVVIVDDTYNANPAGARAALELIGSLGDDGSRRLVVTPGMVELGPRQAQENEAFAREAAGVADELVLVGLTNRKALLRGAGDAQVTMVGTRDQAVAQVKVRAGPGDVVLYENDLPDHYP